MHFALPQLLIKILHQLHQSLLLRTINAIVHKVVQGFSADHLHTVPDVSFVFIHQQGGIHLEKCKMIAKLKEGHRVIGTHI